MVEYVWGWTWLNKLCDKYSRKSKCCNALVLKPRHHGYPKDVCDKCSKTLAKYN